MAFLRGGAAPLLRARGARAGQRFLCTRAPASAQAPPPGGRPAAGAEPARPLRGLALLRADLARLGRLARGDARAVWRPAPEFTTYDAAAVCAYYDARPAAAAARFARVAVPFGLWLARARYIDRWLRRGGDSAQRRADELRRLLVWAGPAYLKIGQAVGNRPDIVGAAYAAALQRLVDDVGAFDSGVAQDIVRAELGVSDLASVFAEFAPQPAASASLGQVHRARLRSGEEVAVKVQRPGLRESATLDVYVLRRMAALAKSRFRLRSDLVGIVDEFAATLWEELDYEREADNADEFRRLYAQDMDDVYVPRMYREYSAQRVLTMEWIDGDKPPWQPREDARRLINVGVQCSLRQLLEKGFVHNDPHIGNLLRLRETGQLVYLDFGMTSRIDPETRDNLIAAIVRLINRDYANLATDFVKLGFLPPDADTTPIAPLLEEAFGDASAGGNVSDLSFGKLADNLSALAFATPIRIPVFFTLVIRSLTILEGIALQTDPNFKIVDEAYPFVVRRILTDDSPVLQKALRDVLIDPATQRLRWTRLQAILRPDADTDDAAPGTEGAAPNAAPASLRGAGAPALAGVSDAALRRVLDFALSARGAFLREALQLEAADTLDALQVAAAHRLAELSGGALPAPPEGADHARVRAGLAVADALRERGPRLLQVRDARDADDARQRQQRLARQIKRGSRAVLTDIAARNARRLVRQVFRVLLGEGK